jgi:raffinose/stachyose/melibiose transport system substrate-binding protein
MKKVILATAMIAVSGLLAGCAPSGPTDGTDDVTINLWSWRTEDVEKYNSIFDVYEEANPGVTIEFQAYKSTEWAQILTTGLTGSNGPDVVMVQAYGRIQPFIEGGNLVQLDGKIDALDEFDPKALAGSTARDGSDVYGVPFASQILTMFYNKTIFADLGLEEPTTWEEFIDANETVLASGMTPLAVGGRDAWTLPMLHDNVAASTYGGSDFREGILDGSKTFEDPAYIAGIEALSNLEKYMPKDVVGVAYTEAQTLFIAEQAAMFPGGSFEQSFFETQNPDLDLGVFSIPAAPGAVSDETLTVGYADGSFAINAASDKQEAALDLVSWIATAEFGQLFADTVKQPSSVPGVKYNDPILKELTDAYAANGAPYLLLSDFRWETPSGTDIMNVELQNLLLGTTNASEVASKLQEGISTWFTPTK